MRRIRVVAHGNTIKKDVGNLGTNESNSVTTGTNSFIPVGNPLDFNIAPTPAHDYVTFSDTKNIDKIEIYDMAGKKVIDQKTFDNNTLSVSNLSEGIYNVRVYFSNTTIRTIKIVKQ